MGKRQDIQLVGRAEAMGFEPVISTLTGLPAKPLCNAKGTQANNSLMDSDCGEIPFDFVKPPIYLSYCHSTVACHLHLE